MDEYEYNYGPPEPDPHYRAVQLQKQHAQILEEVLFQNMMFMPEMQQPMVMVPGVLRSVVLLNDGRRCDVTTYAHSGETLVGDWMR